jgi:CheY-like chemotaxis protein
VTGPASPPVQIAKTSPANARVLVATDNADDAQQIVRQLESVFDNVHVSKGAATTVEDRHDLSPDVLVLAFDTIEKSQLYYLGLYRSGSSTIQGEHRTVILCSKDEVRAAFELCRKDYFDDYVLYWPQSYDGSRLAMSIWIACRQMIALNPQLPRTGELLLHARHLAELERVVADPLTDSIPEFRARLEPSLAGIRPVAAAVRALKPLVMVIDDDDFSRRLVQQALDPERFGVTFAVDGPDALTKLRHIRPDVILMDVRLPGLDGLSLTRQLKETPQLAGIPIVMMTGDSRRETLMASMNAGASAFIVKPVGRASLQEKLDKLVPR